MAAAGASASGPGRSRGAKDLIRSFCPFSNSTVPYPGRRVAGVFYFPLRTKGQRLPCGDAEGPVAGAATLWATVRI